MLAGNFVALSANGSYRTRAAALVGKTNLQRTLSLSGCRFPASLLSLLASAGIFFIKRLMKASWFPNSNARVALLWNFGMPLLRLLGATVHLNMPLPSPGRRLQVVGHF